MLVFSYIVKLYFNVLGSYYSKQILYYETETKKIKEENMQLEVEISKKSSLQYAREKAMEWGFKDTMSKILVIN